MAFAFGARRVSFTALGLLQFLAPSLQFATGIAFGEAFTLLRGVSFALIWAGLGFFAWDTLRARAAHERYDLLRHRRRTRRKRTARAAATTSSAKTPRYLGAPYTIVHLGDLIDRGPDSRGVVERVMRAHAEEGVNAVAIRGNHEELMLHAYDRDETIGLYHWAVNGGDETIASYEAVNGEKDIGATPSIAEHIAWLRDAADDLARRSARARLRPRRHRSESLSQTAPTKSGYGRARARSFDSSAGPSATELKDILVVHGHTPTDDFEPDVQRRRINVDTGACFGGPLTCVVLAPDEKPRFLRVAPPEGGDQHDPRRDRAERDRHVMADRQREPRAPARTRARQVSNSVARRAEQCCAGGEQGEVVEEEIRRNQQRRRCKEPPPCAPRVAPRQKIQHASPTAATALTACAPRASQRAHQGEQIGVEARIGRRRRARSSVISA